MTAVRRRKGDPLTRYEVDESGCWIWQGGLIRGYGALRIEDQKGCYAHRYFYEHHVGPIPDGLVIDHLCRVPACVNPAHLEPVTQKVNCQRGIRPSAFATHCAKGHAFDEANTYRTPDGRRTCRACNEMRRVAYKARQRAARTLGLAACLCVLLCSSAFASYNHLATCESTLRGYSSDDDVHAFGVATGAKGFGGWGSFAHYADGSVSVYGRFNYTNSYKWVLGHCTGGDFGPDWFAG